MTTHRNHYVIEALKAEGIDPYSIVDPAWNGSQFDADGYEVFALDGDGQRRFDPEFPNTFLREKRQWPSPEVWSRIEAAYLKDRAKRERVRITTASGGVYEVEGHLFRKTHSSPDSLVPVQSWQKFFGLKVRGQAEEAFRSIDGIGEVEVGQQILFEHPVDWVRTSDVVSLEIAETP